MFFDSRYYMNIRRSILLGIAAASMICASSCNKDKNESLPYLTGTPQFSLPVFGTTGDTFEFKSGGVSADDGSEVRYYWYASPIQPKMDTCDVYKLVLTDSLCTVKLTCVAFAKGYNSSSYSEEITIVNPDRVNGSIRGIPADPRSTRKRTSSSPIQGTVSNTGAPPSVPMSGSRTISHTGNTAGLRKAAWLPLISSECYTTGKRP